MLRLYNFSLDNNKAEEEASALLSLHLSENENQNVYRTCFSCIDMTSLNTTDSEDSILRFVERINKFESEKPEAGLVASVCVYPKYALLCYESLESERVAIACVSGGFPSSQTFSEVKMIETQLALKDGATEIDTVMNVGAFLNEDYESLCDEIAEMKDICGDATLKVILETGALSSANNIYKASLLVMYSGADFIKTSTGKGYEGATPMSAYVMCIAIRDYYKQTGRKIGFKAAGGMKSIKDCIAYYTIVKHTLGEEWLNKSLFRLGTSSCAELLFKAL